MIRAFVHILHEFLVCCKNKKIKPGLKENFKFIFCQVNKKEELLFKDKIHGKYQETKSNEMV